MESVRNEKTQNTSCTAWEPWTTQVLWLFQWGRTVWEWAVSGAAIVFQRGGPPTWSQWWSKYCYMATSPSLARRVNCGQTAGPCYLSLPPDLKSEASLRGRVQSHKCSQPTVNPRLSDLAVLAMKLANSSPCLWAGFNLAESHIFHAVDKPLTPLWSRRKSEAQREWGAYWRPCHRMTPLVSFPLIQDIRQCIMGEIILRHMLTLLLS